MSSTAASPPPPPSNEQKGQVTGTLVDRDGAPILGARVVLSAPQLRSETHLGEDATNAKGDYSINYDRTVALHLVARAYDAAGAVIATSSTAFSAPAQAQITLSTAKDGVVRTPSAFTHLQSQVTAQLHGTPLGDLKENKDAHEIRFVAKSSGMPFTTVADLFMAHVIGTKHGLRDETLFGLFYARIPASLGPTLNNLPEAGIDDAFMSQVLSGVLAYSRNLLSHALTTAVTDNVLPASYGGFQDSELTRLDALRVQATASAPYIGGQTPVSALLAAGSVSPAVQTAFLSAHAANGGRLVPTWTTLNANTSLAEADLATLDTTMTLGELLAGSLPLVNDTLRRLSQRTLARISDLALLDQNDWIARINSVDPQATSIPQAAPNETPAQRIVSFAKVLAERFAGRYPNSAFVGGLMKARTSSFATKEELISFLSANPTLSLESTDIDQYVARNRVTISAPALVDLKTAQRLYRISPDYASAEALNSAGYRSAQSVYFAGRGPFIAKMAEALGGESAANTAYAQAEMTYATALTIYSRYNRRFNSVGPRVIYSPGPNPGTLANLPDLQALFGSQDYFACEDCQSIYSPAAYLVDLLQYLTRFTVTPQVPGIANACDAFLVRRPEVQNIALTCSNTNVTLPYIDLVNEVLEAIIAPPSPPPPSQSIIIDTLGTSAERRALPQNISQDAYKKATQTAVFPLTLPFDLPFAQTTAYLAAMGMPRPAVMTLFAGAPQGPSAADIACASLGINPELHAVIVGTDSNQQWQRWGFSSETPPTVVDPETRKSFTPANWTAALSQAASLPPGGGAPFGGGVPVLLNRSGLSLPQLYQLLEVKWVTQAPVTLQLGIDPTSKLVSASTELMSLNGVTPHILDRAQRFLRLLNATGLQMWELDWALGYQPLDKNFLVFVPLDDDFLVFLAGAIAVKNQLNLPFQEVLSFWRPLETRDVTNCLGDEPTVVPSTYSEVFANATMLASWRAVFPPAPQPPAVPDLKDKVTDPANLNALNAALGISATDVATILAATTPPTPNLLTRDTVNVLLRYQRLATSLSLPISDLVLWIQLTGGTPFGTTPADTIEFLRHLAVLQGTGLGVHDLDYLLRNQSTTQTALAFTTQQSTALLQTIAIAIGKLTPSQQADTPTVSTIFVGALATATNVTANVVTPVLNKLMLNNPGVLPLSAATIQLLLKKPPPDPTQFPQLVNAFVTVSKAGALYTALKASTAEFAFVVEHASTFGWLDPSALPSLSASPYPAFEALVRAIKLNQRQYATTPKLFDVLGQWLVQGQLPTSVHTALSGTGSVPALALALSTTVSDPKAIAAAVIDASAIATKLGVSAPSFTPLAQLGSLADVAMLTSIANALDLVAKYKVPGGTLVSFAASKPDTTTAQATFGAFQAQYPQSSWFGAVQPVEDKLRECRRDALVAYLLGPGANLASPYTFNTTDDIYDYFLIDPEMTACALSTRLLQASLAIQQFVQQCLLNLTIQVTVDTKSDDAKTLWAEWSWRQQYRLWQANREVFLYPENYVLPETRTNASSFFTDMESDLRQASCDEGLAETALENYMRKLVEVSNLVVAAHCSETTTAGAVLHVFAHTRGDPWKWYYRTRTISSPGAGGVWSAWEALNLEIKSDHVVPVIWDQRLHLVWLVFKPESEKQREQSVPSGGGGTQPAPTRFWSVDVAMSELSAGQWQPKRVIAEKKFFSKNAPLVPVGYLDRPQTAFTLRAKQDSAFNMVISIYYNPSFSECFSSQSLVLAAEFACQLVVAQYQHNRTPPNKQALDAANHAFEAVQTLADFLAHTENVQVATGTLSMPESPMVVAEDSRLMPDAALVDLSQEPTRALVTPTTFTSSLPTPHNYHFSAQDLRCGYYYAANPGTVSLNVLNRKSAGWPLTSIELLGKINNPQIVIPAQEPAFDFLDPFFVVDGGGGMATNSRPPRTYLVEPEYESPVYVLEQRPGDPKSDSRLVDSRRKSSSPHGPKSDAVMPWTGLYQFQTFYHPFARTMLRELEIGGVPGLMSSDLQKNPQVKRGWKPLFDFGSIFQPSVAVAQPFPGQTNAQDVGESALDFSAGCTCAYALYNWEVFYHGPMFVAALLAQNQQYQDAMNWYKYIFNPADPSGVFWQTAPFIQLNSSGWGPQQIQNILENLAQGTSDPDTAAEINAYVSQPFDPHAIASLRFSAYAKATVMKFLDTLIAWGDSLFSNYTAETVGQAEQLYVLADMILGPAPNQVPPPPTSAATSPATYAQIKSKLNTFPINDPLVAVENLIVAPNPLSGTGSTPTLPQMPVANGAFLFCIPPNQQLLSYWTTVADRLYKIRHCMNLQGQVVPLPLYPPPINPLLAAEMVAAGETPSGLPAPAPIYRFAIYLQKAIELVNDVRSFGALILSALEKKDAEALAALRANQELNIQTLMLDVKTQQVTEASDQITALENQQVIAQIRVTFYSSQQFTNIWETQALTLQAQALVKHTQAIPDDITAMAANFVPTFTVGIAGMGGTPQASMSFGGGNLAGSANAEASMYRGEATQLSLQGGTIATLGGYQHRFEDWQLQANIAQAEITQIQSQITAANDRLTIANSELAIQNAQISNAQAISDFLTNKYTNADLYDWIVTQLTTVYTQAYQLAYGLAQQAQSTYQFELGRYQDTFLQPTYWDSQHRGLTSGESLLFDLRRMEVQYLATNARELELTKHISLAITQPMALVQLMETGICSIYLNEDLFDVDHPGNYFRRLRSVAITIPCIAGPYTGVNANLTLTTAVLRTTSTLPQGKYAPATAQTPPTDFVTFSVVNPIGATIATSSGQNDAGLFEVNLHDERWLPFEGQGAISAWTLELNPASNNFDFFGDRDNGRRAPCPLYGALWDR